MQRLEVSGAVQQFFKLSGFKGLWMMWGHNSYVYDSPPSTHSTWSFSYCTIFSNFNIQENLKKFECLAFQCVMVDHFNNIILAFYYWFQHFGMMLRGWW